MATKHTPGPWSVDSIGSINSHDHPICDITQGVWGDRYPTLKIEGPSLQRIVVPIMEMVEYGEIPKEESEANARLICRAPELLQVATELVELFNVDDVDPKELDNNIHRLRILLAEINQ